MVVVGWALPTVVEAQNARPRDHPSPKPTSAVETLPAQHAKMHPETTAAGGQACSNAGAAAAHAAHQQARAAGSPDTVTALLGAAAATGPSTPLAEEGSATTSSGPASAASTGRRAASPRPASPSPSCSHSHSQSDSRSQGSAVAPAELHAVVVHAQAAASRRQELSLHHLRSASIGGGRGGQGGGGVDIPALVERLKQRPLSGQVVAWAWECAAALSAVRRTMPAQLFSALWPATEACACRMMPQDVLEMLESWLSLMQQCPRHFRLSRGVVQALTDYGLPAAVKRMGEDQLAQLAGLARDIALHRSDADMQVSGAAQPQGSSARDLLQPAFALVAAEAAWRCSNPARYVSPETISAVVTAAPAWSWRVVHHRDSPALASLKLATAAALEELVPHSPRDLRLSPSALGKLKSAIRLRSGDQPLRR